MCRTTSPTFLFAQILICLVTTSIGLSTVYPSVASGNYELIYCNRRPLDPRGRYGLYQDQAQYLQAFLPKAFRRLDVVLTDATYGTNSQHGYGALFKTNESMRAVRTTYSKMQKGAPTKNRQGVLRRSTFVCANAGEPDTAELYDEICQRKQGTLAILTEEPIIVICPLWFMLDAFPGDDPAYPPCPSVRNNQAITDPNSPGLVFNQFSVLVHELAHMYNKKDARYAEGEVYGVEGAIELDAQQSLANAQNFAHYASGESCL